MGGTKTQRPSAPGRDDDSLSGLALPAGGETAELLGQRDENRKKVRETERGSLAMSKSECLSAQSVRVAQLRSRRAKSKSKLRAAERWEPKWIVVPHSN